jgi:N-dimethylarginine dimethylaminohydrolase
MCSPTYYGIEYEINPWMNVRAGSDRPLAQSQWETLRATLKSLGASIELVDPQPGLPDMVFTANAGLVYHRRVVLSRFRHAVRQAEAPFFDAWFHRQGFDGISMPEHLHFEGAGDALFCGETLFAGYRIRSDARAHQWIGGQLGVEVLPLELVDPRFYHLDTCFCPLAPGVALYYPGAFDRYALSVLRTQVPRLIEATPDEAASFSCNAVVVGSSVVLHAGAPLLADSLRREGFDVRTVELSEFIKAGGSAKCLTLRLDGEDAATWQRDQGPDETAGEQPPTGVDA